MGCRNVRSGFGAVEGHVHFLHRREERRRQREQEEEAQQEELEGGIVEEPEEEEQGDEAFQRGEITMFCRWLQSVEKSKKRLDLCCVSAKKNLRNVNQMSPDDPVFNVADVLSHLRWAIAKAFCHRQEFKQHIADLFGCNPETTKCLTLPGEEEKHPHNLR